MKTGSTTKKKIERVVLDASVVVKWFSQENGSAAAEKMLQRLYSDTLFAFAPPLLIYEVSNALWKGKQLENKKLIAALDLLLHLPIGYIPNDEEWMRTSVALMTTYNLTFYDAAYAGLAFSLDVPLITANPKDHNKIKEIDVLTLETFR